MRIMLDSGCSSCLFPFPSYVNAAEMRWSFPPTRFRWSVSLSVGTNAKHCPVLKIEGRLRANFTIVLNGKSQPVNLSYMRFHLGSNSAAAVCKDLLQQSDVDSLCAFVRHHSGDAAVPERRHVLLGQSYCDQVFSAQVHAWMLFHGWIMQRISPTY